MASIFTAVRDLDRLREITTVLIRHGFAAVAQKMGLVSSTTPASGSTAAPYAVRIRRVVQDLGPSFIKLAQVASTRADLVPHQLLTELEQLQDNVPPMPFEQVRKTIEGSLGARLEDIYERFDSSPLASASIGQVHRALLRPEWNEHLATDDEPLPVVHDVVVKVQRNGVRDTIERDLDLLYVLAAVLERSVPEARTYRPVDVVRTFDQAIHRELDYGLEADHAERFRRNFAGRSEVAFPMPYRRASSRLVLTQQFLAGQKIHAAVTAGLSGRAIARRAVGVVLEMIFEHGFFHADPHPGNVLVLPGLREAEAAAMSPMADAIDEAPKPPLRRRDMRAAGTHAPVEGESKVVAEPKQVTAREDAAGVREVASAEASVREETPDEATGRRIEERDAADETFVLGLIDLGMVGRLSPELRDRTLDLLLAAVSQDPIGVADAIRVMARTTRKIDIDAFRGEVAVLAEKYLGRPLRDLRVGALFSDLVAAATRYGMEIPADFLLMGKALMTIEGIGRSIDPDLDVLAEARPHVLALVARRWSPERLGQQALHTARDLATMVRDVPAHVREILDDARRGRLRIQTRSVDAPVVMDRLGRRMFSGMVVASLNVAAGFAMLATFPHHMLAAVALFVSAWLAWLAHVGRDAFVRWWWRSPTE